ncbi:MAG: peroxiredoxin [Eubacteriales bacterium]
MKIQEYERANLPQLGSKAPFFEAETTFGPVSLSDYEGSWLVFFSHPGDFTPVCTSEFIAFSKSYDAFKERNTDLLGLSVGRIYSHLAWVNSIYENTGVEIPFPIIADGDMTISEQYGMISPLITEVATVRNVFIIDPEGIVRLILYYPNNIGRNIMEILRCIDALQFSDERGLNTPANWMPGMPGLMRPPVTYEGLKEREISCGEDCRCVDWYFCFKNGDFDES